MIRYAFYNEKKTLMKTYSDLENKNLHKVGTDEVYPGDEENAPIDVVDHIVITEGTEEPRSRFVYEEVDRKEDPVD